MALPTGSPGRAREAPGRRSARLTAMRLGRTGAQLPGAAQAQHRVGANAGAVARAAQPASKPHWPRPPIADALEAEGSPDRIEGGNVTALGDVTGMMEREEAFRAIRFLPAIAQRDRRPMLNALRYYRRHNPFGSYLRMAVVTAGQRVPLGGDLRGRMQEQHRRVSRFAHEARKRFGVEVVYRGTEFTVDEALSFHPHAHLLFAPRDHAEASLAGFLSWMHRFFGAHVHDAGRLVKPEEAIKYPFKPVDLERLDGAALAWVGREIQGLKLAQPLGDFAEFWRDLERRRLKVLLVDGPDGAKLHLVGSPSGRAVPGNAARIDAATSPRPKTRCSAG